MTLEPPAFSARGEAESGRLLRPWLVQLKAGMAYLLASHASPLSLQSGFGGIHFGGPGLLGSPETATIQFLPWHAGEAPMQGLRSRRLPWQGGWGHAFFSTLLCKTGRPSYPECPRTSEGTATRSSGCFHCNSSYNVLQNHPAATNSDPCPQPCT